MTPTIAKLNRTTQAYCNQLCGKETLDYGICYYSHEFPDIAELNQYREVIEEDSSKLPSIIDEALAFFGREGLTCRRFARADGLADDKLIQFLGGYGFQPVTYAALALTSWNIPAAADDVRIIPARAMRKALHSTFAAEAEAQADRHAEVITARMDFAEYDMFVATVDRRPAGRCALFQVGDIARIMELEVLPDFKGSGVRATLLAHVLSMARRLAMPTICVQVDHAREELIEMFKGVGFIEDGVLVEFECVSSAADQAGGSHR